MWCSWCGPAARATIRRCSWAGRYRNQLPPVPQVRPSFGPTWGLERGPAIRRGVNSLAISRRSRRITGKRWRRRSVPWMLFEQLRIRDSAQRRPPQLCFESLLMDAIDQGFHVGIAMRKFLGVDGPIAIVVLPTIVQHNPENPIFLTVEACPYTCLSFTERP